MNLTIQRTSSFFAKLIPMRIKIDDIEFELSTGQHTELLLSPGVKNMEIEISGMNSKKELELFENKHVYYEIPTIGPKNIFWTYLLATCALVSPWCYMYNMTYLALCLGY